MTEVFVVIDLFYRLFKKSLGISFRSQPLPASDFAACIQAFPRKITLQFYPSQTGFSLAKTRLDKSGRVKRPSSTNGGFW